MRIWRWVIVAFLLLKLSANAQQSAYSTASASAVPASAPSTPSTTMDHVVDRALEREHALMQILKFDRQLGPAPVQDHYFLGRMDLGESLDRRDYLSQNTSFESHLLGGFTRLFKFQYKPVGFSWMIYADRDNFNRKTYDFKYV